MPGGGGGGDVYGSGACGGGVCGGGVCGCACARIGDPDFVNAR